VPPAPLNKILIINIFGIGDVLFTTPIISSLKARFPDIFIGYLCNRRAEEVLRANPKVGKIFVYERDEFQKIYQKSKIGYLKRLGGLAREIQKERFDAVIDVSLNGLMGFLTWLSGIKHRIGFDYKGRGWLLTGRVTLKGYEEKHVVDYYLGLLEKIGVPVFSRALEFPLRDQDLVWADEFLKDNGIARQNPVIGLVPGGGGSWGKDAFYKRWPAESYAKLADKLIEKHAARIILMGGKNEVDVCEKVASAMRGPSVLACGKTSLVQFSALARRCSFVITNDGGPLHVAAAAGAKTVSIFGPVDEQVYGPYPPDGHIVITKEIPCRPCYRRFRRADCGHVSCLNQLSVEEVLKEAEKIL
jgi:lipopolysaccharide heptosyltransferase II